MRIRWNRRRSVSTLPAVFTILTVLAAIAAYRTDASGQSARKSREVLYASVGPELIRYEVDVQGAALIKRESVMLPAIVQEGWAHPSGRYLYVTWSDFQGGESSGRQHGVTTFRIDPETGQLRPHGRPAPLPSRPIHATTDVPGEYLLVAHSIPSQITVHRIRPDGTIDSQVAQPPVLDLGIMAHQIRIDPSNQTVLLVTRGNGPTADKLEDPGALKVFTYKGGLLGNRASIAPGGGINFQPRHLDYAASGSWVFVTLERQNKLQVYKRQSDGTLGDTPLFTKDTLAAPNKVRPSQIAGTIHLHPNDRYVYLSNRASGTIDVEGTRVFAGGENTIAVYSINQSTGEPTLIQNIDTHGLHPRTFDLDSTGRVLVVGNQTALPVRDGSAVRTVHANLAVFRVLHEGTLEFVRKYDVERSAGRGLFWMGLFPLPQ
jgi:6-phosphogluconolactonase (cycloisomerase 2 family)